MFIHHLTNEEYLISSWYIKSKLTLIIKVYLHGVNLDRIMLDNVDHAYRPSACGEYVLLHFIQAGTYNSTSFALFRQYFLISNRNKSVNLRTLKYHKSS
jgi:hypothetical protein